MWSRKTDVIGFCDLYYRAATVNDLHIAGHARSEGITLVTNNLREFERVEALRLDNWI
jgi:predicted nucleic acid-binding protein